MMLLIRFLARRADNAEEAKKAMEVLSTHRDLLTEKRSGEFTMAAGVVAKLAKSEDKVDELINVLCALSVNAFSISDAEMRPIGCGFYPDAALLNHSCAPNCVATFRGSELQLRALRAIPSGSELTIAYGDVAMTSVERQQYLR